MNTDENTQDSISAGAALLCIGGLSFLYCGVMMAFAHTFSSAF